MEGVKYSPKDVETTKTVVWSAAQLTLQCHVIWPIPHAISTVGQRLATLIQHADHFQAGGSFTIHLHGIQHWCIWTLLTIYSSLLTIEITEAFWSPWRALLLQGSGFCSQPLALLDHQQACNCRSQYREHDIHFQDVLLHIRRTNFIVAQKCVELLTFTFEALAVNHERG